jgi:predicted transposase YbfD/YdcC
MGGPAHRPGPGQRRVVAVDGKTLRGSGDGQQPGRHLLAALDHARGPVLGQMQLDAKTNEIPLFTTLLDRLEINDAVITADALHGHAACLHRRGAHYLLIVKRNQPGLHARLAAIIRSRWSIEDRLHWVRDLDFDEDRSQIGTAAGPQIMASRRNLVITILRLAGYASIAAALGHHARRPGRPLQTIMNC